MVTTVSELQSEAIAVPLQPILSLDLTNVAYIVNRFAR
jgi:hypothetical protein